MSDLYYKKIHKDWYYSFLNIENIEDLRQELLDLKESDIPKYYINKHYINVIAKDIVDRAPILMSFLRTAGIEHKFERLLFSAYYEQSTVAHVDSYDPKYCSMSLNIPLKDCENSYTVWFNTKKRKLRDIKSIGLNPEKYGHTVGQHFAFLPLDQVTEAKRIEVTRPMLVNTTILHRGEVPTVDRTIVGIRFTSALTKDEIKKLGIQRPFKQVD